MDKCWSRPIRRDPYEGTLWEIRVACQRALETAKVHRSDIERLRWGVRETSWSCSQSCNRRCSRSHNRSHLQDCSLDRRLRSHRGSWLGKRVTFQETEVEPDPKGGGEDYPPEPSILDVESWLDWWAQQIGTPCWWRELRAIPGVEDPWKLTWKIQASFLIPKIRSKVFLGQDYTAPPAPKCLIQNVFLPNELSYQDVWQQPLLLTITYAQGLQYWVEKLNLPENPNFCHLARSIIELREMAEEHIVFTDWDIFCYLESQTRSYKPVAPNQLIWPQQNGATIGQPTWQTEYLLYGGCYSNCLHGHDQCRADQMYHPTR